MSALRLHGDTIAAATGGLDFATCLWPAADPEWLEAALTAGLADRGRYPDEGTARAAIAMRHGRAPEEVLLLNGACEAFWLLAAALRPARAACVHPSFTEPEAALRAAGAEVERVPLEPGGWTLDPALVPDPAQLLVLGNPNNPTGTLSDAAALIRPRRLLVVDESFIELTEAGDGASLAALPGLEGVVVVRSLTKLYALAGIRAGYLLAAPPLVRALSEHRQPWSVNALACRVLAAAAGDRATPRRVAGEVAAGRRELLDGLEELGVRAWPSAANFLLLRVPDGPGVIEGLLARGIAVRPCASFPGLDERFIRIAVRPASDNARLLAALAEVLA